MNWHTKWYLVIAAYIAVIAAISALAGCATVSGPVSWRADQHTVMMQACMTSCHPNGMATWDSITGTCMCRAPGEVRE